MRYKKFYAFLLVSFCTSILFAILYCFEFSQAGVLQNSLVNPWISLFDLFNSNGVNIIASCLAIALIFFFLIFYIVWFTSTKSKSDRAYLSLIFVLLILVTVYGLRCFDNYSILTAYRGDTLGIFTVICYLLALITLCITFALVTLRKACFIKENPAAIEDKPILFTVPEEKISPQLVSTTCLPPEKVTAINNNKIEKPISYQEKVYKALDILKYEHDLKKKVEMNYYRGNVLEIRPLVKTKDGRDERVIWENKVIKKYD